MVVDKGGRVIEGTLSVFWEKGSKVGKAGNLELLIQCYTPLQEPRIFDGN